MLHSAHTLIRRVGKNLGLNQRQIDELISVDAHHTFTVELDSGKKFVAYRVQHSNKLGPYKGGIRFHPELESDEVTALATLMSLKTSAVGLPLGGGKGGIRVDPKSLNEKELEELSRKYVRGLHEHIGPDKDIPAPDVNTNSQIVDWMVDEYQTITGEDTVASFTGKSLSNGGSLGREAATGRGGVIALSQYLDCIDQSNLPLTYAVQGFGNVGAFFSKVASETKPGWHLVAATDSSSGVTGNSLSPEELFGYKARGGRFSDYSGSDKEIIDNQKLLAKAVDVLVLAALGDSITTKNMRDIKAKIIIELANGPVSEEAHEYLTNKGVVIIPDIIANAGGVIVSYLEWIQNIKKERWTENKVNQKLEKYMTIAVKNIYKLSERESISLKEAAFQLAIDNLVSK